MKIENLLKWLNEQLAKAEQSLKSRKDMEACWRGGTDKAWKAVGCKNNRTQRLEESEMQGRIAMKLLYDVTMFKQTIEAVKGAKE